mmetsp:Transcript_21301/g.38257  ORF Transcript_21301/g.38257 Transcript_21301/m.38257 type:complete len:324 (+) Transcript_21301:81-1052(+)
MAPVQFENMQHGEAWDKDILPEAASDESTDEESQLKRTESQALKQHRVQQISQHLSERRGLVKELLDGLEDTSDLTEVEQKQKAARNLGEDLLEDILALDNLSNLFEKDRQARKAALADLEVLTDEVDRAKASLQKQRKELKAHEEAKQKDEEQAAKAEAQRMDEAQLEEEEDSRFPASQDWAELKLPMRFHSSAMSGGWVALAELPSGCTSEDLKMELKDGGSTLRVSGLRLPTMNELEVLNREAQRQLRGRRPTEPQDYLQLGRGLFGRVDEALRLPEDVDTEGISASFRRGVLELTLPRRRLRGAPLSFRGSRRPSVWYQ